MNVFLSGQKSFGLEVFLMLQKRGDLITGVAAPPFRANGKPDPLHAYAGAYRYPVTGADNLRAAHIPSGTDIIVCAHSHAFIGRNTRRASRYGAIGYHPSLLPRHRGRDAVKWTIKMRDPVAGGTVFWLDDRIDGGPIAAQQWCWVHPQETASSLWRDKLFPLGLALLNKTLGDIESGEIARVPQDEAVATFEPALDPPRLFRPELPQLTDGGKTGGADWEIYKRVENEFKETIRLYSVD